MKNNKYMQEFMKYAFLNVLGMIGISCYILADTFFISRELGAAGLTALNLAIPVYNLIHGSGLMLGMGGATKYSIMKSREDERVNNTFSNTIYISAIFAALFVVAGIIGSEYITNILGADVKTFDMTNVYIKVLLLFSPAFILNDVLNCFVRNDGNPKLAMLAMLTGSFSNIGLDYLFVIVLKMGMFGAVFATGCSPLIGIFILSRHFVKKENKLKLKKIKPDFRLSKVCMLLGIPSLVTELASGIVIIVFNMLILHLKGNVGVAAYGVVTNISIVIISVYTGIAQGSQPLLSRAYGEGNRIKLNKTLKYGITMVTFVSLFLYAVVFVFAEQITWIFNSEQNSIMQGIAVNGIRLYFTSIIFAGINIIMAMYFTSIEKIVPSYIISLSRGFVIILPITLFMSTVWKMTGIWLAVTVTEVIVGMIGLGLYIMNQQKGL